MFEHEIKKYKILNELADQEGIVIFGGAEDNALPICELRQAFAIEQKLYNRSIIGLSVTEAVAVYNECVAPLAPETVLLHIGEADLKLFADNATEFDQKYSELILHIKSQNEKCRIAIISLRNYDNAPLINELNKHLKYIADSERCEYSDISAKKVWNPKNTMEAVSFVYSMGFVRPLKNKRSLYDLVKILFCCGI